ncbi:unnamed protein product [Zymoseptoria tritici ST99CH_1A5]|uniref:Uncharacterized protein n=1 Tax=Zymoseptoria tritici ST99CH_1A5 TaxID=1276529 RepID=A0A1Y6LII2_ZYMTR|nr:unnamed protein product [Zymoseptoria tritici ST99CH_1A5]
MPIQNILLTGQLVTFFAVCCTADFTLKKFPRPSTPFSPKSTPATQQNHPPQNLTLIHDLSLSFTGATSSLTGEDLDFVLRAPFAGMSYADIQRTLQHHVADTGSQGGDEFTSSYSMSGPRRRSLRSWSTL